VVLLYKEVARFVEGPRTDRFLTCARVHPLLLKHCINSHFVLMKLTESNGQGNFTNLGLAAPLHCELNVLTSAPAIAPFLKL
jgi:hypothetical protein